MSSSNACRSFSTILRLRGIVSSLSLDMWPVVCVTLEPLVLRCLDFERDGWPVFLSLDATTSTSLSVVRRPRDVRLTSVTISNTSLEGRGEGFLGGIAETQNMEMCKSDGDGNNVIYIRMYKSVHLLAHDSIHMFNTAPPPGFRCKMTAVISDRMHKHCIYLVLQIVRNGV